MDDFDQGSFPQLQVPVDNAHWCAFVPKLLLENKESIFHQRPARNIAIQYCYLEEMSFENDGRIRLEDLEVVYRNIVYNGLGEVKDRPIHTIVEEAYPHKIFKVSKFIPSGLQGFIKLFLPPLHLYCILSEKSTTIRSNWSYRLEYLQYNPFTTTLTNFQFLCWPFLGCPLRAFLTFRISRLVFLFCLCTRQYNVLRCLRSA